MTNATRTPLDLAYQHLPATEEDETWGCGHPAIGDADRCHACGYPR